MEENKTILTDEQVEEIVKTLEENQSETTKHLREIISDTNEDIPYNTYNTIGDQSNLIEAEALVEVDPESGTKKISADQSKLHSKVNENIELDDIISGEDEVKLSELTEENMVESLKSMDYKDEEVIAIMNILRKDMEGIEVTYDELPMVLKRMVNSLRGLEESKSTKNVTKDVIKYIRNQLQLDQEYIDFMEVLKKEMKLPSIMSMFSEENDELMTTKMREKADSLEETDPEKAKLMREISNAYEDAKNFVTINRIIDNNEKPAKKLQREIKRFNKYIRDFNYKYNHISNKFTIDSLNLAQKILVRHTSCTPDKAIMFLILFCRISMNMDPNNVVDHTFMYYTLKAITTLDAFEKDDETYIKNREQLCNILDKLN